MFKKYNLFLILVAALLIAITSTTSCTSRYGHDRYGRDDRGFGSADEAFRYGYNEGYEHGIADRQRGLGYDYRHDHKFRSGISYNRYVNQAFREGYVRGYTDGYYGRRRY